MQLERIRKYSRIATRFRGLLSRNPVLYSGLALPFAVSATYSLCNGVALSILMLLTTLPTLLVASLIKRRLPQPYRIVLYSFIAMGMLFPGSKAIAWIAPNIFDSLGIYFSLMCINSLVFVRAEEYAIRHRPHEALLDGLFHALGFSLVVCVLSLVRELFGSGTLWGTTVDWVPLQISGLLVPFSGFILLGFFAAAVKASHRLIRAYLLHSGERHLPEIQPLPERDLQLEQLLQEQEERQAAGRKRRRRKNV